MSSIAVVGAGAWGTALAIQAARAGHEVTLWARDPARAAALAVTRENPRLPGARLPEAVRVAAVLPTTGEAVLLAIPMQHLRAVLAILPAGGAPLVPCAKGVEQGTLRLPLEIVAELHPGRPAAVLTGPNFAHEVAAGQPAATVVATENAGLRTHLAGLLATATFRVYGNADPIGAQVGGAAKNVIAIAAGAVIGAGLGENARAGLITRGLAELGRAAAALGGRAETVMGLSGVRRPAAHLHWAGQPQLQPRFRARPGRDLGRSARRTQRGDRGGGDRPRAARPLRRRRSASLPCGYRAARRAGHARPGDDRSARATVTRRIAGRDSGSRLHEAR